MLGQAVEDVFSSPAVLLATFEVQDSVATSLDADADADAAAKAAASATQNRGGAAGSIDHGLDLDFMNALYTSLLKVRSLSMCHC